jgi:uncharacterized small protein (DUF1192 family)
VFAEHSMDRRIDMLLAEIERLEVERLKRMAVEENDDE